MNPPHSRNPLTSTIFPYPTLVRALCADQIDGTVSAKAPRCLIVGGEAAWMATVLRPVLERAGYHVTASLKPGETAAVVLAMEDDPIPDHAAGPLVRLS